jgi:hypothetical protein
MLRWTTDRSSTSGQNDVFDIPRGYDGWVTGSDPMLAMYWSGVRTWIPEPETGERVLATVLFTDIVGSTEVVERIGDRAWRELLGRHTRELKGLVGPRSLYRVAG